jgi:DNA (cytosine-5)-methyltransferase 1
VDFSFKHLALFNGIGGFQLAADWMGWENVAHVEINDWCNKVVKQHFPNSKCYTDIKNFDGKQYANKIDIISGGFPCQPFSVSGKRKGDSDDRFLWPENLRVIREIQPFAYVGENVPGIISMALDQVLNDLENEGYTCQTFIIPASGVGAWHKRERIWIVAYNSNARIENLQKRENGVYEFGFITDTNSASTGNKIQTRRDLFTGKNITNSDIERLEVIECKPEDNEQKCQAFKRNNYEWPDWTTEPGICGVVNGIPNRVDRIKGLGNAIVPQVAYEIFKAIQMAAIADKARGQKVLI